MGVYVDDLLLLAKTTKQMAELKKTMADRFKMKDLGVLHHLLGLQILMDDATIRLDQATYVDGLLKRFTMEEAHPVDTPADLSVALVQDDGISRPTDTLNYQRLVGSLLFAAVSCRPDIAQAVAVVCRYTANPSEAHWTAAKRILRYLKRTKHYALTYRIGDSDDIVAYCDADFAGDRDSRKSTTGHVFVWAGAATTWVSQKQQVVALSTTEAEYVALSAAVQQGQWILQLLVDIGEGLTRPLVIREDNQAAIQIAKNPVLHKRTKHIDVRHHFVRDVVHNGIIELSYINTKEQVADILTKALPRDQFQLLRTKLGLELSKEHDKKPK